MTRYYRKKRAMSFSCLFSFFFNSKNVFSPFAFYHYSGLSRRCDGGTKYNDNKIVNKVWNFFLNKKRNEICTFQLLLLLLKLISILAKIDLSMSFLMETNIPSHLHK